jgi:hypothetical protein
MKATAIQVKQGNSYKIGMNEVVGLRESMLKVMKPLQEALQQAQGWGSPEDWFEMNDAEYTSRDGFIPHSHNCGGIQINQVIPECGSCDFPKLDFPEFEPDHDGMTDKELDQQRDSESGDGLLDAHLRVWLKLESVEKLTDGNCLMKFYLVASNCTEAPYFRHRTARDLYECEFHAVTLKQFENTAAKKIKELIKAVV